MNFCEEEEEEDKVFFLLFFSSFFPFEMNLTIDDDEMILLCIYNGKYI